MHLPADAVPEVIQLPCSPCKPCNNTLGDRTLVVQDVRKSFSSCLFWMSWSILWYPWSLCCRELWIISPVLLLTAHPITHTSFSMKSLSLCNLSTCRAIPQPLSSPPLSASLLLSRVFFPVSFFFPSSEGSRFPSSIQVAGELLICTMTNWSFLFCLTLFP